MFNPATNGFPFFRSHIGFIILGHCLCDNSPLENVLEIGRFKFSQSAFERAVEIIRSASTRENGFLIIDEIGPLELKQKGFHNVLTEVLLNNSSIPNILLVVRKALLEDVFKFYSLKKNELTILEMNAAFFSN